MEFMEPTKTRIRELLKELTNETEPRWGLMTPQHMVEHLTMTVRNATGDMHFEQVTPDEKLPKLQQFLFSDQPMPRGHKVPHLPEDDLPELQEADLDTAKEKFLESWDAFVDIYEKNPGKEALHPVFGTLGKTGWYQVHRKHFTHHFQQFGLL